MGKIRFLATGDFHSDSRFLDEIEKNVVLDEIDFVFLTGDISEKKDDFEKLLGLFKGKQIFMVPGNHESKRSLDVLKEHYGVELLGNRPVLLHDDLAIFGTNYLNIGPHGIPEEEVFKNLLANFNSIKNVKRKVMLAHIPPIETKIGNGSPFHPFIGGSMATRAFLEEFSPDYALVGHIHETSGLEEIVNKTKVVNVAQTFKVFEFDVESCELKLL